MEEQHNHDSVEQSHSHDEHEGHYDTHEEHDHSGHDDNDHDQGPLGWLREAIPVFHGHSHSEVNVDRAMETSDRGIWALKVSLVGLGATAIFQVVIVLISGSVALLADTIHNFSDALTAVPLWIAFVLGRKAANRRYTYGYGRAEDVAGIIIVLMIALSAIVAGYESYQKIVNPTPISNVGWVIIAAIVGFLGNEAVAVFRIKVGNEIGSAALVADGQHARIDGLTSLAVLFGAIGSIAGFPLADPIIGVLITIAILFIVRDTAVTMWHRIMDGVDPALVDSIEKMAAGVEGAQEVHEVRVRWLGHKLQAELHITVDEDLSTRDSHRIAENVRHALFEGQPRLSTITVHVDPCGHSGEDAHEITRHHTNPTAKGLTEATAK
ncbi:MAG: cation diffusion facilitator family transporter [Chloroflexota bacterium]